MAKKLTVESYIHFELDKLQVKVDEFQTYLEMNPITAQVTQGNEVLLTQDNQDKLHKEIVIQIKMQDALFSWMPLLEKLKETAATKELVTRGDVVVNGMFKNRKTNEND